MDVPSLCFQAFLKSSVLKLRVFISYYVKAVFFYYVAREELLFGLQFSWKFY